MAGVRKKTAAKPPEEVTAAIWCAALKDVTRLLRAKHPRLKDRANDIASEAAVQAVRHLKTHALTDSVGALTWTIALKIVAKEAARDARAKRPALAGTRQKPTPAEQKLLAPVFRDFMSHAGMLIHDVMWGASTSLRLGPGAVLLLQLQRFLPHLYDHYKVPRQFRLTMPSAHWLAGWGLGAAAFIANVNAFAREIRKLDGTSWVESEATLHVPLRLPGKPRRDPYLAGDHGPKLQKIFLESHSRHAGLHFEEKRRDAANAIVRHALAQAGMSKTLLNGILRGLRAAEHRVEKARERAALRAYERAEKTRQRKT